MGEEVKVKQQSEAAGEGERINGKCTESEVFDSAKRLKQRWPDLYIEQITCTIRIIQSQSNRMKPGSPFFICRLVNELASVDSTTTTKTHNSSPKPSRDSEKANKELKSSTMLVSAFLMILA